MRSIRPWYGVGSVGRVWTLSFKVSVVLVPSDCTTVFFYIPDFLSSFRSAWFWCWFLVWGMRILLSVVDVFCCVFLLSLFVAACRVVLEPGSVYVPVMC